MTASTDVRGDVAFRLIGNDLLFARRYLQDVITRGSEPQAHIPMFCMTNYLSLYIYEAQKAIQAIDSQLAAQLAVENAHIIERSRHTVKFFDDTNNQHGGVEGVATQFDKIIEEHRDFFLGNTWFPPARVLETDLAVYRYRGRLVSTTHVASFYTGLPPETINDPQAMGRAVGSLAEGQARYISTLVEKLPWQGSSFLSSLSLDKLTNKDRRASKYYANAFDVRSPEKIKAALMAFQCAVNFLELMVSEDANPDSAEAIFKLKFVTLYHVLSSLEKFKTQHGATLSSASTRFLDVILDHQTTTEIMRTDRKGFRNVLIHFVPIPQVVSQLSLDKPLCGLVEVYYPNYDYTGMSQAIDEHTRRVARALDEWSNQPG